jgi:hypothetical protein
MHCCFLMLLGSACAELGLRTSGVLNLWECCDEAMLQTGRCKCLADRLGVTRGYAGTQCAEVGCAGDHPVINMTCHGWGKAPAVISRQKAQAPLSWCTWQPSQNSRKECCALHTKTVYRQVCLLAGPSRCQRLLHRSGTSTAQQLVKANFNLPVHVLVTDRSEKAEPKTKLRPDFTLPHL